VFAFDRSQADAAISWIPAASRRVSPQSHFPGVHMTKPDANRNVRRAANRTSSEPVNLEIRQLLNQVLAQGEQIQALAGQVSQLGSESRHREQNRQRQRRFREKRHLAGSAIVQKAQVGYSGQARKEDMAAASKIKRNGAARHDLETKSADELRKMLSKAARANAKAIEEALFTVIRRDAQAARNGRPPAQPQRQLTRFPLAEGKSWVARVARGLTRWREQQGLTIPAAAERFKLDQTALYRMERAKNPGTTAIQIDHFCDVIGVDIVDLLKLGA